MRTTSSRLALAFVALIAIAACSSSGGGSGSIPASTTTSVTPDTTTTTTPTVTTTTVTTTTVTTTTVTTTTPATTVTLPPPATSTPSGRPGAVTGVTVTPGGGIGEVVLDFNRARNAVGYRVFRSDRAGGPFVLVAKFNVFTGHVTVVEGVVNLFSAQHQYVPAAGPLLVPDGSARFELVDLRGSGEPTCFGVIAYNTAGDGVGSTVVCGSSL